MSEAVYNRSVGVTQGDPAFVAGQVMKATDTNNAKLVGGTNNTVQIGTGTTYADVAIPLCNPFAIPPTFLWFDTSTRTFQCVGYGLANGVAGAVQRSDGTGKLVGDATLLFDGTAKQLTIGDGADPTKPGTISFRVNAATTTPGQIDGRGGGQFWRMYGNRSMGWSMESGFIALDSQNDSTTDALTIGKNNSDPLLATTVWRLGEDGTMRLYGATDGYVSLIAPATGAGTSSYTLPTTLPPTTRYCLVSDLAGVWSWASCALLLGRSGGQILLGGTASGEFLSLGSNAGDTSTGAIKLISNTQVRPDTITLAGAAASPFVSWPGTVNVTNSVGFPPGFVSGTGTLNYGVMPFFGLGTVLFGAGLSVNFNATGSYTGPPVFDHLSTYTVATGTVTTLSLSPLGSSSPFNDDPRFAVAGTGAFDAAANYLGFKSKFTVNSGTIDEADGFRVYDAAGAGALNKRGGLIIDNFTKCTAPNCKGISNSSTTDEPGAIQTLAASTAITGCGTRTSAYLAQSSASATLRVNATPTIADGRDGQRCRLTNVDSAGNTKLSVEDETVTAGTNLRVSTAATCPLCLAGTCALDTRDSVEFTFNSTLGDWIMTACNDN